MNDIAFSVIINNDGIDDIIFKTIMVKGEKGDGGTGIDHIEKTSTSGNVDTYTIYLEDGSVAGTFTVTNAILPETATIENVEIASFSDGADDVPVSELIVDIEPVQDLHGYDHPWAGGAGKNKLQVTASTQMINGITFTVNEDGSINLNGTATAYTEFVLNSSNSLKAGTYIANGVMDGAGQTKRILIRDSQSVVIATDTGSGAEFSLENDSNVMVAITISSGVALSNVTWYPMIRLSTVSDATFEPYENICPISGWDECNVTREHFDHSDTETQTIDFGETTAFGGFLDVLNGKLTLTLAKYVYNSENIPTMSESAMSGTLGGKTRIFINQSGISRGGGSGVVDGEICDRYDSISSDFMYRGNQGISLRDNVTTGFYIYNPDIQGRTAWQQEISTNGLEVVAPLAEPIVIQLTPAQVRTLLNDNNIFADTGKIQKVTYFKTGCEALARLIDAFK